LLRKEKPQGPGIQWDEDAEELDAMCEESQITLQGVFRHVLWGSLSSGLVLLEAVSFRSLWPACPGDRPCPRPACPAEQCEGRGPGGAGGGPPGPGGACWLLYLDPALCLAVTAVALRVAVPGLRASGLVLLQAIPRGLDLGRLQARLLGLEGVDGLHELHVWQVAGSALVASAHVRCRQAERYPEVAARISGLLHQEGILTSTVQPEFGRGRRPPLCELACGPQCASKLCCSGELTKGQARDPGNPTEGLTPRPRASLSEDNNISAEYETSV
ncbi:hypothetical protein scyTo_0024869, partial [Scyliorhinus torazame]|nr:hypothetical protein [Scyliorhinus torazame]